VSEELSPDLSVLVKISDRLRRYVVPSRGETALVHLGGEGKKNRHHEWTVFSAYCMMALCSC
jgi:hypothetical protein